MRLSNTFPSDSPRRKFDGRRKENLVTPPSWVNAVIRSVIWLGGAAGLAYVKKPDGASALAVRPDAIGWLAGGICVAGLMLVTCSFFKSTTLWLFERVFNRRWSSTTTA